MASRFWIGHSGWSYPDWNGRFYPRGKSKLDQLAYVAEFFNAVEVNVSFYRPLTHRMTESWVQRVAHAEAFRFSFKLTRSFTHDRTPYTRAAVASLLDGVAPVVEAGLHGALLLQFPWSFKLTDENRGWIDRLCDDFSSLTPVVEVRHQSWDDPRWRQSMSQRAVPVCQIDQPALRACLGVTEPVIAPTAYFRFHGRRTDAWFARDLPTYERYNYLYSQAELAPWVDRIKESGETSEDVFVFTNNHYKGQAPANALQLRAMIEGSSVLVPQPLIESFPALRSIHRPDQSTPTGLFDF